MTAVSTVSTVTAMTMELLAPAKINLFLQVIGQREDGYHELNTLMCCIGLYDRLVLAFDTAVTGMSCSRPDLPCDPSNLALKAVAHYHDALRCKTQHTPEPVSIHLTKEIPIGAGLGGGSSDAAAVLKGLNVHYGYPLNQRELAALALALGADVPFFIDAVPAFAQGIGEKLRPYNGLPPMTVVIVFPGFGIPTGPVYRNLNLRLTKCEKEIRNFPFNKGDFIVPDHLCNDLESVAIQQYPVIARIKRALVAQGAEGALMTGSGSAVFGLFSNAANAQHAAESLQQWQCRGANSGYQVFVTHTLS